jgi:hypothetical protein
VQPSSDTGFASELVQVLNGFQQSCLSDILCVFSVSAKLASKSVNFLSVTPNFFRLHHKPSPLLAKALFKDTDHLHGKLCNRLLNGMARLPAEPKTYRQIREVGKSAVQERQRMASWDKGHRARNIDTEKTGKVSLLLSPNCGFLRQTFCRGESDAEGCGH